MNYVIRVNPPITYEVTRLIYDEAYKLGIFTVPLYDHYVECAGDTLMEYPYLGVGSISGQIVGCQKTATCVSGKDTYVIDLRDVL